jgi:undecaprenyl-diphosphatase
MAPSPRRFLLLALLGSCAFALLATLLAADTALLRFDSDLVDRTYHFTANRPDAWKFFVFVTDLGAGRPLWIVGTLAVLALALRREYFRALVWAVGLLGIRPLTSWLKNEFRRVRPPYVNWQDFSFPSGHAFGSAIAYGMLALVVLRVWHGSRWRWVFAGALWAFIGLVALSRPMLGVHYPSDVLAGMSLGLGWGFFWAAIADWFDLRRRN